MGEYIGKCCWCLLPCIEYGTVGYKCGGSFTWVNDHVFRDISSGGFSCMSGGYLGDKLPRSFSYVGQDMYRYICV